MSASSRGARAVSALIRGQPRICPRCARGNLTLRLLRRPYSAAATAAVVTDASPPLLTPNRTPTAQPITHPKATHKLKAGIILTRAPLLTRALQPFETSFFLYQKRLHERLSAPFHAETYFKEDTAVALDWAIKLKERQGTPAKDIGAYRPRSRSLVRDEEEVGSTLDGEESIREALVLDAELRVSEDGEEIPEADRVPVEPPRPRRTEADEKGDVRRLDRELDRTLYLVVQNEDGSWGFPCSDVLTSENLHETAARVLESAAGVNMNTWIVGRVPIAHVAVPPTMEEDGTTVKEKGEKVFFLKGRIMAGQADISGNTLGLKDFRWLTKGELEQLLPRKYFHEVRGMFAER